MVVRNRVVILHLVFTCSLLGKSTAAQTGTVPPSHLENVRHGVNLARFEDGKFQNDSFKSCAAQDLRQKDSFKRCAEQVHNMGFDHVRILVMPGMMFDPAKPQAIESAALQSLDEVVRDCLTQRLAVILALSVEEDRFKDMLANSDFVQKLAVFWAALASHYSTPGYPADMVFFEILNEPQIKETAWYGIETTLAHAIRNAARENTILATGAQGSVVVGLLALSQLLSVENVIYVFHYYEPYAFTHQGEDWDKRSYASFLAGVTVKYPYTAESVKEAASKVPDLTQRLNAAHDMLLASEPRIEVDIDAAYEWAQSHEVPLMCDEFGVIRTESDNSDRARWVGDVKKLLDVHKIGWTFWDYSSDKFGIISDTGAAKEVIQSLGMKAP